VNHVLASLALAARPASRQDGDVVGVTVASPAVYQRVLADTLHALHEGMSCRRWLVVHLASAAVAAPGMATPRSSSAAYARHPVPCGFVREKIITLLTLWQDLATASAVPAALPPWTEPVVWALKVLDLAASRPASAYVDPGACLELVGCAQVTVRALAARVVAIGVNPALQLPAAAAAVALQDACACLADTLLHVSVDARASASLQLKRSLRELSVTVAPEAPHGGLLCTFPTWFPCVHPTPCVLVSVVALSGLLAPAFRVLLRIAGAAILLPFFGGGAYSLGGGGLLLPRVLACGPGRCASAARGHGSGPTVSPAPASVPCRHCHLARAARPHRGPCAPVLVLDNGMAHFAHGVHRAAGPRCRGGRHAGVSAVRSPHVPASGRAWVSRTSLETQEAFSSCLCFPSAASQCPCVSTPVPGFSACLAALRDRVFRCAHPHGPMVSCAVCAVRCCRAEQALRSWLEVVVAACRCRPAYDVRLAAANAVRVSRVLASSIGGDAGGEGRAFSLVALSALLAAIELLYDTDDEVRDAARCAIDVALATLPAFDAMLGGSVGGPPFVRLWVSGLSMALPRILGR
jgi:hypothetical protein